MGWGTNYKYTGYLPDIGKDQVYSEKEDCERVIDMLWREILGYMNQTPPTMAKDGEGGEYPWPEFLAMQVQRYREDLAENYKMLDRFNTCLEVMEEHPEDVTES